MVRIVCWCSVVCQHWVINRHSTDFGMHNYIFLQFLQISIFWYIFRFSRLCKMSHDNHRLPHFSALSCTYVYIELLMFWVNSCFAECILGNIKIFLHFLSVLKGDRAPDDINSSLVADKDSSILYHVWFRHGIARRQSITSLGIQLVPLEYSCLNARNVKSYRSLASVLCISSHVSGLPFNCQAGCPNVTQSQ